MDTKIVNWIIATLIRAIKTFAQSLVACIGTSSANIVSLDWLQMLGIAATAFVLSVLTSVAGIKEVENGESIIKLAKNKD